MSELLAGYVMDGPCLNCQGSQPEHAGKTCDEVRAARSAGIRSWFKRAKQRSDGAMGNWVINIEGTGCHHNGNEKIDADLLAPKLVEQLQQQGQSIEHATFTSGGRQNVMVGKTEPQGT